MMVRIGLRQLNEGKIYRKLGRADCRNDFFKHALEYLKGREILFVISLPYFYCAGLAICATLPFLEV